MDDEEDLEFLRLQALKSLNNKKEITFSSSIKARTQRNDIQIVQSQIIKFPVSQQNHTGNERKMLLCDTNEPYIPKSVNVNSHWGTIDGTSNGFVHYVPTKIGIDDTTRLTKVQLSPRSAAFVSENNDILRKRIGGGSPVSSRSPTPKYLNSHRMLSCDRWSHSPPTTQPPQQSSLKLINRRSTTPFMYRSNSLSKSPPPLSPTSHQQHPTNKRRNRRGISPIHRRMSTSRSPPTLNSHRLSSKSPQSHHTLSSYLNQNTQKSNGLSKQRYHSKSPDGYHMVRHQYMPDFHKRSTSRSPPPPPSSPQRNRKFSYNRNRSPYNKRNSPPYYQQNVRQSIPNNYQNSKHNVRRSSPNHSNSQSYNKNNNNRPRSLTPPSVHPSPTPQRSKINRNISPSSSSSNYQRSSGNRRRSRSPYNNNKSADITRRSLSRSPHRKMVKKSRDFNSHKQRKLSASESRPSNRKYNIRSGDTNSKSHRTNANNKMNERYKHSYNSNQQTSLKSSTKRTSPTKRKSNSRSISRTPPLENIGRTINYDNSNTPPLPPISSPTFQMNIPLEQHHNTKLNDNKSQQDFKNHGSTKSKDTEHTQSKSTMNASEIQLQVKTTLPPQVCKDDHIENSKVTSDDDDDTNDELEDGIDLFASEESASENEGRFKSNNGKTERTTSASTVSFSKLGSTTTTDIRELNDMNNDNDEKPNRIRNNQSKNRYYTDSADRKGNDKYRKLNTRNTSQYSSNHYNNNNSTSRHNWKSTKSNNTQSSSSNSNNNPTINDDAKKCNDNSTCFVVQTELSQQSLSKTTIDNIILKKIPSSVIEKPQQTIDGKTKEQKINMQLKHTTNMIEEKEKPTSNNSLFSAIKSIDNQSTSLSNRSCNQESTGPRIGTNTTTGGGLPSMGTTMSIVKKPIHLRLGAMTKTWDSKKVWKSTSPTNNTTTVLDKTFQPI